MNKCQKCGKTNAIVKGSMILFVECDCPDDLEEIKRELAKSPYAERPTG